MRYFLSEFSESLRTLHRRGARKLGRFCNQHDDPAADIENNTWVCIDMEFLIKCLTHKLMHEMSSWTWEEKFHIYKHLHVLFCLSYKHNSLLLKRKVNLINESKQKDQHSK